MRPNCLSFNHASPLEFANAGTRVEFSPLPRMESVGIRAIYDLRIARFNIALHVLFDRVTKLAGQKHVAQAKRVAYRALRLAPRVPRRPPLLLILFDNKRLFAQKFMGSIAAERANPRYVFAGNLFGSLCNSGINRRE